MTTPNIEHSSSNWCQSRLLRARREASRLSTRPALPSPISAIRRWNPPRSEADAHDLPRSSSIAAIRSRGPHRGARRRLAEFVVVHRAPLARPAQGRGAISKAVLQPLALLVLAPLHGRL